MSIQSEINRIAGAKSDIADAIEDKDVTVPSGTKLDGMANLIRQIPGGSEKLNSTQAADAYDPTATYAVGDKVSYAGNVYSCISAISTPEAWDSTHWDQVDPIQDQVDDVKNTLNSEVTTRANADNALTAALQAVSGLWTSGDPAQYSSFAQLPINKGFATVVYVGVDNDAPITTSEPWWWNVIQFGASSRLTQIAFSPFRDRNYVWIRNKHDNGWYGWYKFSDTLNPNALSLTLASGSWSSATPPTQTVSATGVTASNIVVVGFGSGITSAQYDAASKAKLACTAQGTGTITMTAFGTKPTVNIPISVAVFS